MRYFFPVHLNAGNRGCEAIARGTAKILGTPSEDNFGLCTDVELDRRLGIDREVFLYDADNLSFAQKVFRKISYLLTPGSRRERLLMYYDYLNFFKQMRLGDVMLSTGGDMMCYGDNQVNFTSDYLNERGFETILWGCSMGPENLTPAKERTLHNFSLIYARESLSCEFFKRLGLKNVCQFPDPAFILEPEACALPDCFSRGEVIGINISNYVLGGYTLDSAFGREIVEMLDYLIGETDLQILLVPHVTWDGQDDRVVARMIAERYKNAGRISVLAMENLNYCQIRYVISMCKLFVGARTHAVISAYSTCVPTLALGYSIKSKGIAKDLGLAPYLVIDSKNVRKGILIESLVRMIADGEAIRQHLKSVMPDYRQSTYGIRKLLKEMNLV